MYCQIYVFRDALRNLFRTGLDMRPLPVENVYANTKPNKNIEVRREF